jgi:hypothetical protein
MSTRAPEGLVRTTRKAGSLRSISASSSRALPISSACVVRGGGGRM